MKKLFEMYAVKGEDGLTIEEMIPQIMQAMSETLDDLIQQDLVVAPDNVHMSAYHEQPCPGVGQKDWSLCTCGTVRFEVYTATDADVALNMASGTTVPVGMVGSDDNDLGPFSSNEVN